MNTTYILCLFFMCLLSEGHGTVADFFDKLPGEISHALSTTWNSIVEAVKRPVRLRRLGPGAKRKALRARTTTTPYIWSSPKDSEKIINDLSRKAEKEVDVHPKSMSLDTWVNQINKARTSWTRRPEILRTMTIPTEFIRSSPKAEQIINHLPRKAAADIQVNLPLILHSKFKSLESWINQQKIKATSSHPFQRTASYGSKFYSGSSSEEESSSHDESYIFGPLVFI